MDLVSEVRQLDRRITKAATDTETVVSASGTTLTDLHGIGALTAGKILCRVGGVGRFRSAAAFASYTGTAPIEGPPARWSATDFLAPAIASSTAACTSWPSPKSAKTPLAGPTT